jgi:RND family efflux transporter MFP subunit
MTKINPSYLVASTNFLSTIKKSGILSAMKANFNKTPFLIALFSTILLTACEKPVEVADIKQLRPVRTITLEAVDYKQGFEFTAVVDAVNRADLAFKISGELTNVLVKQGDKVKRGDVIAKLDDTDLKIYRDEAQAQFDKAMADLARANNLIKTQYISASEFDQIRANSHAARAQLATANNNLSYSVLTASFDGVIAKVYSKNHQEINAKEPIVRLHDLSQIQLIVNIPESTMIHLQKNSAKDGVSARFNSIDNKVFPLQFSEVSTVADEYSKTYEVIFTMDSPTDYIILPGMTASVSAQVRLSNNEKQSQPSFFLPSNTVLKDITGHYVFVVNKHEQDIGEISRKKVVIGNLTGQGIEIFSGLVAGDHIVSAGMSKVSQGTLVKFTPVSIALAQ